MLTRLKQLNKRQKFMIFALILLIIGGGAYAYLTRNGEDVVTQLTEPDKKYYSRLSGVEITKDEYDEPVFAAMIENSEEARPQTGLDSAGIVFETVTEAGITRYLALFHENKPTEIGPVRSVRPAFVDWAMGFDVAIAHVGGSEQALGMLDDREGKTLNQFFNDGPYYRRSDRVSPHNMYLRVQDFLKLQKDKEMDNADFADLQFTDAQPAAEPEVTTVSIQYSQPLFTASFSYDQATSRYVRSLAGSPHVDAATNQQISVKNVVVIKKDIQASALGEGTATLYSDGKVQPIKWQQKDFKSRISFMDQSGNEVVFSRGDIWVAVIPPSGSVTAQ